MPKVDDIEISEEEPIIEAKQERMADINLDELIEKHTKEDEKEEEGEETKDEPAESEKASEETKTDEETKEGSESSEKQAEEEVEGYYADEALEDEAEEEKAATTTPQDALATHVYENLQPIQVTGTSNGKTVNLSVKVAEELPDDFSFNSVKEEAKFNQSLAAQAIHARNLADQYVSQRQQEEATAFTARERRDIATDIAKLQREGLIPTFTPGLSVDEDPRAEVAREVLKFYEAEKAKRLEAANANQRLYYPPSFEDAYYLWKSRNNQTGEKQKAEDKERKEIIARQPKTNRGANASEGRKGVGLPSTASWDQVINEALKLY